MAKTPHAKPLTKFGSRVESPSNHHMENTYLQKSVLDSGKREGVNNRSSHLSNLKPNMPSVKNHPLGRSPRVPPLTALGSPISLAEAHYIYANNSNATDKGTFISSRDVHNSNNAGANNNNGKKKRKKTKRPKQPKLFDVSLNGDEQ